jgi:ADP-ribosylglycohydrolase
MLRKDKNMNQNNKNNDVKLKSAVNSIQGLWVGDCIGNVGSLYYAHDILKALDEGIMKFGSDNIQTNNQYFQYSDDTEEAIVLFNHIDGNSCISDDEPIINQDRLALEFAERYWTRDPDGEIYGYGLMTRKVLKDIYDGIHWSVANQTKPRIEGPSFVDKMLGGIIGGKSINQSMAEVNTELTEYMKKDSNMKIGSCGNGSAMRVAPLGAFCFDKTVDDTIRYATLQSEVTHCHPEGIAGSIAVTLLSRSISLYNHLRESLPSEKIVKKENLKDTLYDELLMYVPKGQVWDGIKKSSELPLDTPIGKLIEILGNGTHVTCQDTIPLCVFLTIRAITQYDINEMYEKVIIETCKCFGDVDTNCSIVGGMIGIISPPPEKWVRYCQPMEGLFGQPLPDQKKPKHISTYDKSAISDVLNQTEGWGGNMGIGNSTEKDWKNIEYTKSIKVENIPSFNEMFGLLKQKRSIIP